MFLDVTNIQQNSDSNNTASIMLKKSNLVSDIEIRGLLKELPNKQTKPCLNLRAEVFNLKLQVPRTQPTNAYTGRPDWLLAGESHINSLSRHAGVATADTFS